MFYHLRNGLPYILLYHILRQNRVVTSIVAAGATRATASAGTVSVGNIGKRL